MILSISDHINLTLKETEKYLSSFTYPVFAEAENDRPDLFASSVLIEFKSNIYLVTASHVIDELNKANSAFHLGVNGVFLPLENEFIRSRPTVDGEKDNFDIAVYELPRDFVSQHSLNYITESQMLVNKTFESVHITCIHGYPCSKNKQVKALKGGKSFNLFAFTYAGKNIELGSSWSNYEKNPEFHACMSYSTVRAENGGTQMPPSPKGISGGGVWIIPNSFEPTNVYLKGIFIEYFSKEKVSFCTKIDKILKFIEDFA
ncbi:hypothetical protein GBN24_12570 [Plesiomonas shigelloides]|uniref:hypothetical protein n=1 Tax=Plesiomonas shigelloides TaxID=703 RepID=UPI001261A9A2|nr:hypothetical protein [Plesiomonas shigelloides]KAB7688464.1 hypothetical protein GBN24_12570 [Plesiomonas shigelloides]